VNIYLFELKAHWKNALIWTLAILLFLTVFQLGIYPAFSDSINEVMDIISNYPKPFLAAFGFSTDTMFNFIGFFSLTYSYLALMGAIMAVSLSVSAFAREKRSKCFDFLLTKPRSRGSIFWAKMIEVFTLITISNFVIILIAALIYVNSGEPGENLGTFLICISGLFFTQIVFTALGTAIAIFAKKIRSVSGIATAVGFSAFILSALYSILKEEPMRYLAPLKYFDPVALYSDGSFELQYVCTAIIITIGLIGAAYFAYCKRDTQSV
jgi:ABC-2 type transport system permease protein